MSQADRDIGLTTVAVDYCYFKDDGSSTEILDEGHTPILTAKDRGSGALFTDMVPEKGASIYAIDTLQRHILWLGYDRIKCRSYG